MSGNARLPSLHKLPCKVVIPAQAGIHWGVVQNHSQGTVDPGLRRDDRAIAGVTRFSPDDRIIFGMTSLFPG
jgi:hypothetical protein